MVVDHVFNRGPANRVPVFRNKQQVIQYKISISMVYDCRDMGAGGRRGGRGGGGEGGSAVHFIQIQKERTLQVLHITMGVRIIFFITCHVPNSGKIE